MDLSKLSKKLVGIAQSNPPGEQVPYAFEKSIMARLRALPQTDEWVWWGRALWRGAAVCTAVALLFSAWSLTAGRHSSNGPLDLEDAVTSSLNGADITW